MKINVFVVVFVLLLPVIAFCDDFRYLRTQEGLYDGEVTSIAQDSTGVIWIASYAGLTKYDGTNFQLYRPELGNKYSIPDKKIKTLYVDTKHNLWIASARKLCIYNKEKNSFYTIKFDRKEDTDLNILYLNEFEGNLVIHTVEGFYFYPLKQKNNHNYKARLIHIFSPDSTPVPYFGYSYSANNKLYVIDRNDTKNSRIYKVIFSRNNGDTLLKLNLLTKIDKIVNALEFVPNENALYLATNDGLNTFSLSSAKLLKKQYLKGENIINIKYTSNNNLYCSGSEPRLLYVDLHSGLTGKYLANQNQPGTLLNNTIQNLFEDFSGNLWVGHQGQGISLLNLHKKEFKTFRRNVDGGGNLISNTILSFAESEKEYIIGCRKDGLNFIYKDDFEKGKPVFRTLLLNKSNPQKKTGVWDIVKEKDNKYWLATESGLYVLYNDGSNWISEEYKTIPSIDDIVWKLFIDNNGNIWAGTYSKGLVLIPNPERNPEKKYYIFNNDKNNPESISDNYVKEIFLDSKNRFWIGTLNGLNCLTESYDNLDLSGTTKPELKFKRYVAEKPTPGFLNSNEINCVIENYDGKIWVSTQGGGINVLTPETDKFEQISTYNGLPTNDVYGMVTDAFGNMWISTNNGLVSHNQLKDSLRFTSFDRFDGIQGQTFMVGSYYKANNGMLFFGGDNGFTAFHPQDIVLNAAKPKVLFSKLFFRGKQIDVGDTLSNGFILNNALNYTNKISLPFKKNYFKIVVSTPHFEAPEKNKFEYKLEGVMKNWGTVYTADKTIEFANLPFGNYKLYVKALSSDNVESADIKMLDIEIEPPWYRTWYITLIFVFIILTLLLGVILILITRQKLIYQKQLDELTIANNENKMMFLTNIAHELRTPLSLIIAPIEDLISINNDENLRWKNHLQLINRNSKYLLRLINQIIDFRKLNAGKLKLHLIETDIVRVTKDVVLNFKGFESKRNIKLYLQVPSEKIELTIDPQKIEEVLYNLISNAFKNTFDNHSITVSMSFKNKNGSNQNDNLRISVFNQGPEIDEENKSRIFERFYKINENVEGAGIGLSFAKSLIEMHNGEIGFETIEGEGVTFYVDLPVEAKSIPASAEKHMHEKPVLIQPEPVKHDHQDVENQSENTILIVEDNIELLDFLKLVLSRKYKCLTAENGKDGWEVVKKQKPAIVISDIIMPKLDGLELCKLVKSDNETCHIPIILLSAKNADDQKIEGYKYGADSYLTKPFDINLLLSQISRLIKNRELIREKYRTQNFMVEVESNASKDHEFVEQVRKLLEENISDPEFNVKSLSQHLNISTTQLYRKLKAHTGHSPVEFIRIIKLQKAYNLLSQRNKTVKEVCYLTGFNNLSYFIKCFKQQFNTTPANFRDYGKFSKNPASEIKITQIE